MSRFAVILPAAGRSTRFGGNVSKIFSMLNGQSVLYWSTRAFVLRTDVEQVVISCNDRDLIHHYLSGFSEAEKKKLVLCEGGACRAESVRAGVRKSSDHLEWIAIHDAARPLPSQGMIDRVFDAARRHGCAVPALPVSLTIRQGPGPLPAAGRIVPRHDLWAMQTPQAMRRKDLLDAFGNCPLPLAEITDDAQLIELAGMPVWMVEGEDRNIKITHPIDLKLAGLLMQS